LELIIQIDHHNGVPVYRQIMDQVRFAVLSGSMKAGEQMPSVRQMSAKLGVNPMTISKAYSFLERDGLVERRPGRPLVVLPVADSEKATDALEELRKTLRPAVAVSRQLGIENDQALDIFQSLLKQEHPE
jgi:GntR family transcriptional regulator